MGACLQCSLLWSDDSGSCEFLPGSPARTTETGRSNSQFAAIHLWSAVHFYEKPEAGRRRNAFQASALRSVGGSESREWSRALRQKKATRLGDSMRLEARPGARAAAQPPAPSRSRLGGPGGPRGTRESVFDKRRASVSCRAFPAQIRGF